ncbi:MAG TPA: NAD(P)-dependent oxidoreductase [Candidatus Dormibacteraeota bacterium]|jgi:UDP-glucose 4-epimerase|nr:NAD(P)-dependent oxidoreductase [Candidatus Dormibacteraeota bacterium]
MRIFLTGATGQVGRAIATFLADQGHQVAGASRQIRPAPGLFEHVEACLGAEDAFDLMVKALRPCEAIVHAAASLSHDNSDPLISLTNCLGTQQIIKLAHSWGASQLVYISSLPVIGRPVQHPITEDHPTQPPTTYHASKLYGECLMRLAEGNGCRAASLRLTSPSGPGTPENRILAVFVRRAVAGEPLQVLGRGSRRQNYVDVRDVAVAVDACLTKRASGVYNIAAADSISNYELAQTCISELSSSARVDFAGKPDPEEGTVWDVSVSKACRDLGYRPQFTIRDSIRAVAQDRLHRDTQ